MTTEAERRDALRREVLRAQQELARARVAEAEARRGEGGQAGGMANPQAMREVGQNAGIMARGAVQGATFGFADELAASSPVAQQLTGQSFDELLAQARAQQAADRETAPGSAMIGEMMGAAATGLATGPRLAQALTRGGAVAPGLGSRVAAGAGAGAIEGAVYGAGTGEGAQGRVTNAMMGAAAGGLVGGAVPVAGEIGRRALVNPVGGALGVGNQARANNAIARAADASGMTPDDIARALSQAADDGQPQFTVADAMGRSGQRTLAGAASQPGPARQIAAEMLDQRQLDQGDRLAAFIRQSMGADETAEQAAARLTAQRASDARTAYGAARENAGPVDIRNVLAMIDERVGPMREAGIAGEGVDNLFQRFRNRLAAARPERSRVGGTGAATAGANSAPTSVELADFSRVSRVRQEIADAAEAARRAGRGFEAGELRDLVGALDEALEASSEGYRAANAGYASASRTIDAVGAGQAANRPGQRAEDVLDTFRNMTPAQRAAFRTGYADRTLAQIEAAQPNRNMATPLRSTRQQNILGEVADNPDRLLRQIERENTMSSTRNAALGGSRTAELLADQEMVDGEDITIVGNILAGRYGAAAGQAGTRVLNAARGSNEATREAIARALLSSDPDLFARLLAEQQRAASQNALVGAGLRNALRIPVQDMAR